ncbi:MAG: glycosyltransferase family 2 protein [Acidobacteriaceae bacterium]
MQVFCSIVIPVLNEEEAVRELYVRLKAEMAKSADPNRSESFEIIFVDDGSTDGSFGVLRGITEVDSCVKVIRFRKRYGKTAALAAGFEQASGEYIITMDGDLQHDPKDIPRFLEKLEEGYDIVCGWRERRVDNVFFRRIPSRIANKMMRRLSKVEIDDFGGGFKGYRASLLKEVPLYGGMQRFIPALASSRGARICQIPIENIPRRYGKSRYGISRVIPVFFDLFRIHFLLTYLQQPLRFFGGAGIAMLMVGLAGAFGLATTHFWGSQQIMQDHGPLLVVCAVLVVAGIQFIMMGLLGEMILWFSNSKGGAVPREYAVREVSSHEREAKFDAPGR